jgi:anthranilate/para-aminobenzoate synthase component II
MPTEHGTDAPSVLSGSLVDWLQGAGLEVVPIPYTYSPAHVYHLLDSVNALCFQGGPVYNDTYRTLVAALLQESYRRLQLLLDDAEGGAYIPVFGICHGLQLVLSTYGALWPLESFNAEGVHPAVLRLTADAHREGRLNRVTRRFPRTAPFSHGHGFSVERFRSSPILHNVFRILSTTKDRNGETYISMVEGKSLPIYLTQFHPEIDRRFDWMADAFAKEVQHSVEVQQAPPLPRRRSELRLGTRTPCPPTEQPIVSTRGCYVFPRKN